MVFQVPIKMLGDMAIETCHYITLIEMGVTCTFLISIQGNYRIDCIQILNKLLYCSVSRSAQCITKELLTVSLIEHMHS